MDRSILQPVMVPTAEERAQSMVDPMVAVGSLIAATIGASPIVDGLACTAASGLNVSIAAGSITAFLPVDTTAFGILPAESENIYKMGINIDPVPFSTPAPITSGQSIAYLIECSFAEADQTPLVELYYNSSAPLIPFNGPGNTGAVQYTRRVQRAYLQIKAGTAATTGTQVTPTVDAGAVPLWVVTIPYGAASVSSAMIAQAPNAPFIVQKLIGLRRVLQASLTLYVATTGNDGNNGSQYAPFLTLQAAWNYIVSKLDLAGNQVTVNVAAGTYAPLYASQSQVGGGGVSFVGTSASISAVNASCFFAAGNAQYTVSGFALTATGASESLGCGLYTTAGGIITFGNCAFGTCQLYHISSTGGGQILCSGNYLVTGGARAHYLAKGFGTIGLNGITITLTGTPGFSDAFAEANNLGYINVPGNTFTGSVTGLHYYVTGNSVIYTNSAGTAYLPGSTAGSALSGGQYT